MADNYGYMYVYDDLEEEDCLKTLRQFSVPENNIYIDKGSDTEKERMMYNRMLKKIQKDDLLYINSLSCLGFGYEQMKEQWSALTERIGADVIVLDIPLLDTSRGNNWMKRYTSSLVTEILSFVALNDHTQRRKRQAEGIEAAREKGVHLGRPLSDLPDNFQSKCIEWKVGKISCSEAAKECGMPVSSFRYRAKIYLKNQ